MFENYKIAVKISISDSISVPLGLITRHLLATEGAAAKLQSRLTAIKGFFVGGTALLGGAASIAAPLIYAIDKAAELQKQMIGVQLATRGTTGEMDTMRVAIEKIAGQTIFSIVDVAKMAKQIATGTGLGASQVTALLPTFGRFADVQALMKGTPYDKSTNILIRAAHLANHYDTAGLNAYANLLTKASFVVPGDLTEIANALQYSQGIAKSALGVDDESSVLGVALLNRLGLKGSRGGTNLIAAMTRTIPGIFGSGLLTGKSNEALAAMGMIDASGHAKVFQNGKFDMFSWMGLLGEYVQREFASHPEAIARQDIMKNFQRAFGVQGSRVASLLSTPQALEQWRLIGQNFNEQGGVETIQKLFAQLSVSQQFETAFTNFVSAMTELGTTLLPTATRVLNKFNAYMKELIDWMQKNPEKVKEYAVDVAKFAAALGALGILSVVTSGVIGLVTTLGLLKGAVVAADTAIAAGGLTASIGGFTLALKALGGVMSAGYIGWFIGQLIDDRTGLSSKLGELANDIMHKGPYDPNAPPGSRRTFVPAGKGQSAINVHTTINLDGQKVAESTSRHQAKAASAPQTGLSDFDWLSTLTPAGGL